MAFRNSILAGEELVRSGIRSPDYAAGVAGWRIARDGTAEFSNVVVRGVVEGSIIRGSSIYTIDDAAPDDSPQVALDGSQARFYPGDGMSEPAIIEADFVPNLPGTSPETSVRFTAPYFVGGGTSPAWLDLRSESAASIDPQPTVAQLKADTIRLDGAIEHNSRRMAGGGRGGLATGSTNSAGTFTIAHGLGYTPTFAVAVWLYTGNAVLDNVALVKVSSITATSISFRLHNSTTGATIGNNPFSAYWYAGESW